MLTFLRKLFIKDYKNVNNPEVRTKHGIMAAIGGVISNLLLFSFKLLIGLITASISIVGDAINNLTDLFSCIVNLVGFKLANKPADNEHPYGHERIEYIAGMIISFVIISVAVLLGYESILKLVNQEKNTEYNLWAFIILGVSIIMKMLLGLYYYGIGKAINSITLQASKQDSFNDCISTGVVLICAIIQYFYPEAWYLDPSMSIIVAIFIFVNGIKMIKDTASPLIGISPNSDLIKNIVKDVKSHKGILGVHDVICHSYGPTKLYITLHAEVDGYENMFISHDLIDNIETDISKKYSAICTIHMDPIDTKSEEIKNLRPFISDTLFKFNPDITFHDLRIVKGETHTNVIFDILVPSTYKDKDCIELVKALKKEIKLFNSKYNVVINVDHDYSTKD
jgi:cation diffusion facilitator family transporter